MCDCDVFQRRGPQRSVDVIVSASFYLTISLVCLMCIQVSTALLFIDTNLHREEEDKKKICTYVLLFQ